MECCVRIVAYSDYFIVNSNCFKSCLYGGTVYSYDLVNGYLFYLLMAKEINDLWVLNIQGNSCTLFDNSLWR